MKHFVSAIAALLLGCGFMAEVGAAPVTFDAAFKKAQLAYEASSYTKAAAVLKKYIKQSNKQNPVELARAYVLLATVERAANRYKNAEMALRSAHYIYNHVGAIGPEYSDEYDALKKCRGNDGRQTAAR